MSDKTQIEVYDNLNFKTEELEEFEIKGQFSFVELSNVYVEVTENQIILFLNDAIDCTQFSYLKFKNINQLKNKDTISLLEKCLLLNSNYPNVYYHWVYDVLPQLAATNSTSDFSILTLPFKFKYQSESLNYFKQDITLHNKLGCYNIKKLIIPNPTTKNLMPFEFVFDYLRSKISHTSCCSDYIYITRRKGLKRRIINETLFINYLKNKGFKIFNLEELSFREQKRIFESAKLIVSAHGSGLTNIIFSNEKATILEIYGPGCGERCFAKIALNLNITYHAIQINKLSYSNFAYQSLCNFFPQFNQYHFEIDLQTFERYYNDYVLPKLLK